MKNETQFEKIDRVRAQKRKQASIDREANKDKRKKMKKVTMFGVLGLDPIMPPENPDSNTIIE